LLSPVDCLHTRVSRENKTAASVQMPPSQNYCQRFLEREIDTAADHSEVILRSVNYVPAEVVDPADVTGESNFHTTAELAHDLRLGTFVIGCEHARCAGCDDDIALTATEDSAKSAEGVDVVYGIEVSGEWGGKWRVTVKDGKFEAKPEEGDFEGCKAVFSFDPSDFVLTSFQRFDGGTARGDQETIDTVRKLFFRI